MSAMRRGLAAVELRSGWQLRRAPGHHRVKLLAAHGVDLVLDVGAARGGYATSLRRHGYRGRIASFEPLMAAYAELESKSASDGAWEAFHLALGASSGTTTMNVAANSDSSSLLGMLDAHREAAPHAQYVTREAVEVERLDALWPQLRRNAVRPFLKIDTQGFEKEVLDGALSVLPELSGLELELSFVTLYEGGAMYDQLLVQLRDAGFAPAGLEPSFKNSLTSQVLQADFIFLRV